jgi:phage terminase large subunit
MRTIERRIRWYQRPLHEYLVKGGKRAIEIAHRRWGKDEIALAATCELAHKRIASYWHCLPEFEQARKTLWTAINPHTGIRRIDEAFPPEVRESKDEHGMFIQLRCGSTWQLVGSDRYNALVGAGVAGIVFSEWALANPSAWGYMMPMLEENDGWALFITTPRGHNHAKSMYEKALTNPRWFAELSTIIDTKALDAEALAEALEQNVALYGEDVGHAQFEQEYYCSFNAPILGAYYGREIAAIRAEGRIRDIEPIEGRPVHTAWDIGVRDDTSIWWFQVVAGSILVLDCYTASGVGVEHYASVIKDKPWSRGTKEARAVDYVPHDAKVTEWGTGRTRIEQMQAHGLNPMLAPNAGKLDGIQASRLTLKRAIFDPRCEKVGIAALEQFRRDWDADKKTFRQSEVHDWTCHLADAWRYLSLAWREVKPIPAEKYAELVQSPRGLVGLKPPPKVLHDMSYDEFHAQVEPSRKRERV